jgi:hypothetical protein
MDDCRVSSASLVGSKGGLLAFGICKVQLVGTAIHGRPENSGSDTPFLWRCENRVQRCEQFPIQQLGRPVDLSYFADMDNGLVVGSNVSAFTHDGGKKWTLSTFIPVVQRLGEDQVRAVDLQCLDAISCWVSFDNGSVYTTGDFAKNWRRSIAPGAILPLEGSVHLMAGSLCRFTKTSGLLLSGKGTLLQTNDAWQHFSEVAGGPSLLQLISDGAGGCYGVGEAYVFAIKLRSTDR